MIETLAIVGYGRFGSLLAEVLRPFARILVTSRTDRSAEAAAAGMTWVDLAEAAKADAIILAVAIPAIGSVASELARHLRPGTLVMDACSVKCYPLAELQRVLPSSVEILGTHPMFGPDGFRQGLEGKQVVLSPIRVAPERVSEVQGWWERLGVQVLVMTPEEHDRQVAISQAVVHLIGRAVEAMAIERPSVTTINFDRLWSLSRSVASDTWDLFYGMQNRNPYAPAARERFTRALADVLRRIEEQAQTTG